MGLTVVPRIVRIGELELGGGRPVICAPIVAATVQEAVRQAEMLAGLGPDLLEWRADYVTAPTAATILDGLVRLRRVAHLPLLLTLRRRDEGGDWAGSETARVHLLKEVAESPCVDALDVEYAAGARVRAAVREALGGRPLILSWHDYTGTPEPARLIRRAHTMAAAGADIVKLAVMAHDAADGLKLLTATDQLRTELPTPFITMSMGPAGAYTRAVAPLLGSALTFAAGVTSSAPGQFALEDLRRTLALFSARR